MVFLLYKSNKGPKNVFNNYNFFLFLYKEVLNYPDIQSRYNTWRNSYQALPSHLHYLTGGDDPKQTKHTVHREFFKVAILHSHDCTKFLRFCAKFLLMNTKKDNLAQLFFVSIYPSFILFYFYLNCIRQFLRRSLRQIVNQDILIAQMNSLLEGLLKDCFSKGYLTDPV